MANQISAAAANKDAAPATSPYRAEDISAFAARASLEVPPRNVDKFLAAADHVPEGTEVFLNVLATTTADEMVAAAKRVHDAGFRPVPHLAARLTESDAAFAAHTARLAGEAGVEQVMLVGGDRDTPLGPYESSVQLLESGHIAKAGILAAGIAGYPEGHPGIADAELDAARARKFEIAAQSGMTLDLVTQVCFDPAAVSAWIAARRAEGVNASVRIGIPGPARLKTLVQYGAICGVGQSLRMLKRQTRSMAKLLTTSNPDAIVLPLAAEAAADWLPHFFSFGGVGATAKYLAALREGRFEIAGDGESLTIED